MDTMNIPVTNKLPPELREIARANAWGDDSAFVAGVEWLYAHLHSQARLEFDEQGVDDAWELLDDDKKYGMRFSNFMEGARWQFERDRLRIKFCIDRANEGTRQIKGLVEALKEISGNIAKPISMTDALIQLSEIETKCDAVLAAYKKGMG